jgi:hypothetical protein
MCISYYSAPSYQDLFQGQQAGRALSRYAWNSGVWKSFTRNRECSLSLKRYDSLALARCSVSKCA